MSLPYLWSIKNINQINMKTIKFLALAVLVLLGNINLQAQTEDASKPTIIFVHGVWADGSSWSNQISALQAKGYPVTSVQNPVTSLADDVAATKRAISIAKGKVILVGHSWGGMVISQAGNDPKVIGLVYVAALAPDLGESITTLNQKGPAGTIGQYITPVDGFLHLSREGVRKAFAQDLPEKEQDLVYATQTPGNAIVFDEKSGEPAWKTKKSWFVLATEDKAINPEVQRFMAKRANAKTTEIKASHVVMLSHPKEVLSVIEEAAKSAK
jgi:pimeloyl-ACP methyl ester carboxylesterase